MNKKDIAVIIPIYKCSFDKYEQVAFRQCVSVLGDYSIVVVKPENLNEERLSASFSSFCDALPEIRYESFDNAFFEGISGYNNLMLSEVFYRRFVKYEYILIYQLDAFVFRDELLEWCKYGYDYIGAPWIPYDSIIENISHRCNAVKWYFYKFFKPEKLILRQYNGSKCTVDINRYCFYQVGNGGFSLRKPSVFLKTVIKYRKKIKSLIFNDGLFYPEDVFFCLEVGWKLKKPGYRKAMRFSVEENPRFCYLQNGSRLPFGCHAWTRKEYADFWKDYIIV